MKITYRVKIKFLRNFLDLFTRLDARAGVIKLGMHSNQHLIAKDLLICCNKQRSIPSATRFSGIKLDQYL